MRRAMRALIAITATAGVLTTVAIDEVAAKTSTCGTAKSNTKMDGMDGMDEHHGEKSMVQNCPVVRGARVIAVTGDEFAFSPSEISIAAGEDVTIALTANDIAHDFYVKGIGHIVHAKANKTAKGGLRIKKAGTYEFWCTVQGHKKAGMTGTLTVT